MCKQVQRSQKKLIQRKTKAAVEAYALFNGGELAVIAIRKEGEHTLRVLDVRNNSTTGEKTVPDWKWSGYTDLKNACRMPMCTRVQVVK